MVSTWALTVIPSDLSWFNFVRCDFGWFELIRVNPRWVKLIFLLGLRWFGYIWVDPSWSELIKLIFCLYYCLEIFCESPTYSIQKSCSGSINIFILSHYFLFTVWITSQGAASMKTTFLSHLQCRSIQAHIRVCCILSSSHQTINSHSNVSCRRLSPPERLSLLSWSLS